MRGKEELEGTRAKRTMSLMLLITGAPTPPLSPILGIRSNPEERGVIPNSFDHIFTHIARTENKKFLVRTSYLEIYQVRAA